MSLPPSILRCCLAAAPPPPAPSLLPTALLLAGLVGVLALGLFVRWMRWRRARQRPPAGKARPDAPLQVHLDVDDRGAPLPAPRVDLTLAPCPKCRRFIPGPAGRRYCPADDLYF